MKNLWLSAIVPVLMVTTLVACNNNHDDDGGKVTSTRTTTPDSHPQNVDTTKLPQQTDQGDNKNLKDSSHVETDTVLVAGDETNEGQPDKGAGKVGGNVGGGPLAPVDPVQTVINDPKPPKVVADRNTGASNDYLREYLTQQMNSLPNADARALNKKFAQSIEDVHTQIDRVSGVSVVNLKIAGQQIVLQGTLLHNGWADLTQSEGGSYKATMTCVDANQATCFTIAMSIEKDGGSPDKSAISYVLVRRTSANFSFATPTERAGTESFKKISDMFTNTIYTRWDRNSLEHLYEDTFEVIGGRSGLRVYFFSHENEVLAVSGPLVAAREGNLSNALLSRQLKFDDLIALEGRRAFRTDLQDSLKEARLVSNDGHQNITLLLTIAGNKAKPERTISVAIHRVFTPILSLQQLLVLFGQQ